VKIKAIVVMIAVCVLIVAGLVLVAWAVYGYNSSASAEPAEPTVPIKSTDGSTLSSCLPVATTGAVGTTSSANQPPSSTIPPITIPPTQDNLTTLPVVDDNRVVLNGAEANADARTPPVVRDQPPLTSWEDAVAFFSQPGWEWYIRELNARASKTGFDWEDAKQWAEDAKAGNVETRLIHAYGKAAYSSEEEIRAKAATIVGQDVANRLDIIRHRSPEVLINTRGFGHQMMQDYKDYRSMVRVSLAPIVYNEKGEMAGLRGWAGIFVECHNLWWIVIPPEETTTTTSPPTTSPPTTKPPTTSTTLEPKHPKDFPPSVTVPLPTTTTSTTLSSTTTTTSPKSQAGPGAMTTVTTPPTSAPPATLPATEPIILVPVTVPNI
jgi:hypothetical protein